MKTYTIHNARVLRVDRTRPDPNGHRGARLYAQEGVAGPLFILTISGKTCPHSVGRWAGRRYDRVEYAPRESGSTDGRMLDSSDPFHFDGDRIPDLSGTDDSGDARAAGGLLVDLFDLRPATFRSDQYRTSYGSKTKAGLARTVLALVTEEAGK